MSGPAEQPVAALPDDLVERMIDWRHHLHRYPECGFEVEDTARFVAGQLRSFGLDVATGVGRSGVVASLRGSGSGGAGAAIGLRADMDALQVLERNEFEHRSRHPGRMHACGHDGHTAMLLGAASHLADHRDFDGTVHFIFQPDEEHGRGAQAMIDDGLFERFPMQAVFGLHNLPGLAAGRFAVRPGPIMASESGFEIEIRGTGGHAAMPQAGVDPLVVGAQVVLALQTIVSRRLGTIDEPAVVSVTEFITDGTINVLPSRVTLKGDCRCFGDASLARIRGAMQRIVEGTCQAAGAQCDFRFVNGFHATINDPRETAHALVAARRALGEARVESDCMPLTLSEDFASMLRVKPGCYALLGNGEASRGGCALHNARYDFNDAILAAGARYWIELVHARLPVAAP